MRHIRDLHDENMVLVLSYLRATDLASALLVDRTIFFRERVGTAINILLKEVYVMPISSPMKKVSSESLSGPKRPDELYIREIANISFALSSGQPLPNQGTWMCSDSYSFFHDVRTH